MAGRAEVEPKFLTAEEELRLEPLSSKVKQYLRPILQPESPIRRSSNIIDRGMLLASMTPDDFRSLIDFLTWRHEYLHPDPARVGDASAKTIENA